MKKKRLLSLVFAAMSLSAMAEQALVIHLKDGTQSAFVVDRVPRIATVGDGLRVTAGNQSLEYPFSSVNRFAIEDIDPTIVSDKVVPRVLYRLTASGLVVEGAVPDGIMQVYDTGGRPIQMVRADHDGRAALVLGRGMYIIRTQNETIKIMKK
ncbi:MAG: hypothetical protein IJ064_00505 [Bacteroidaceae bacterium]|nr:hypothetical protein [Bacteroidaceae bacterium]